MSPIFNQFIEWYPLDDSREVWVIGLSGNFTFATVADAIATRGLRVGSNSDFAPFMNRIPQTYRDGTAKKTILTRERFQDNPTRNYSGVDTLVVAVGRIQRL